MILYLDYGSGLTGVHIDLAGSEITCEEFDPGVFADPTQLITQATAKLTIHGKPALSAATADIGRLQVQVQTNTGRNLGPQVYLYYSPTDDRSMYRARVYAISFAPAGDSAHYLPPNRFLRAAMVITHGVWQGALTQIPLTNAHGTDNLSGLQIENTYAGARTNICQINDEDIVGDLPAPIRLEITNTSATARIFKFYISNNVNSTPGSLNYVLEGEAGTPLSNIVEATASNGNTNRMTINTAVGVPMTWAISSAMAGYLASNQFHVLVKFGIAMYVTAYTYMQFSLEETGTAFQYWVGDWVKFPDAPHTADYGVIRLPPWRLDTGASSAGFDLIMKLAWGPEESVNYFVDVDAVYLMPIDSYRNVLVQFFADQNERLVDDMIEDDVWMDSGVGTARTGNIVAVGSPILVHPHRDQRLYILTSHDDDDTCETTCTVKAYYRPLRLAI